MITYESLERFAKSMEGQTLRTQARRSEFTVRCVDGGLEYLPKGTRKARYQPRKFVQRVLDRYNQTHSLSPGDYHDISANASYLMTLIALLNGAEDFNRASTAPTHRRPNASRASLDEADAA